MDNLWTEREIRALRVLHKEGCSYSEIAKRLGRSRNAVSGKVKRLGMAGPSRKSKPMPAGAKAMIDLGPRECRYGVNNCKGNLLFCAKPTVGDRPYCEKHFKLCYRGQGNDTAN